MKKADKDIPILTREQLGIGVRGKYAKHFADSNNVGQRKEREKEQKGPEGAKGARIDMFLNYHA